MKLIDGISMATSDISRRKLRSILTIIAISVGCMLLVSMQGLGDTISKTATTFISSFGNLNQVMVLPEKYNANKSGVAASEQMNQKPTFLPYTVNKQLNPKEEDNSKAITNQTLSDIAKIKNVKDLFAYSGAKANSLEISGVSEKGSNPLILGFAKDYKYKQVEKVVAGKDLTGAGNQFLINEAYLKDMGITDYNSVIGKEMTLDVSMPSFEGMPAKKPLLIKGIVQGIYKEPNAYYPGNIITLSSVTDKINAYYSGKKLSDYKTNYSMVTIDVANQKVISGMSSEINTKLGYGTFSLGEVVGIASVFTGFIKTILDIAAVIVIAVASVGLVNTMTMTVQEKRKWIGIMRALGSTKGNIRTIFLTQSIVLGVIGGVVGCILAIVGIFAANLYLTHIGKDFNIHLTFANVLLGFIVTFIVAIVSGISPARRAAKLKVVETINEE
ncbi:ABC transporter permease [uncultured Clostridium sp.]|uniref:ABC transporter permease n=1 Tax=uncultured Clostridium sp. TaxID=59620 RepID=UPI0026187342|nr:ABC transporter permease [uncultured Clostridium sp.]